MELFRSTKYLALFSQVLFFIRSSKTFAIFDMKPFSLVLSDFIVSLGYWGPFLVVLTAFKIYRKIISLRITCDIASWKYHNDILSFLHLWRSLGLWPSGYGACSRFYISSNFNCPREICCLLPRF